MTKKISVTIVKPSPTNLNIYSKLQAIQSQIKELIRTEENKFQKYWFFNELQVLQLLKPLLDKYRLTLLLSDDISQPFTHEKEGKEHYVKYLKKLEIVDCEAIDRSLLNKEQQMVNTEDPQQKLLFNFWACGSNVDLAKAKGSSETYAIKYLLSKFFLMPVQDEGDPDYRKIEKDKEKTFDQSLTQLVQPTNLISSELLEKLIKLFVQKTSGDKTKQGNFLIEMDQQLTKQGVAGTTHPSNFRSRLALLTPLSYQHLYNWLLKLEENNSLPKDQKNT